VLLCTIFATSLYIAVSLLVCITESCGISGKMLTTFWVSSLRVHIHLSNPCHTFQPLPHVRNAGIYSSARLARYWYVRPSFSHSLSPSLHPRPYSSPSQQTNRSSNEYEYNSLILGRVSLEACCEHILLLFAGTKTVA